MSTVPISTTPLTRLSRSYLNQGKEAVEADNLLAAGCLLRESLRGSLKFLCEIHDCKPNTRGRWDATLPVMAKALQKAGVLDAVDLSRALYAVMIGNRLTRCRSVNLPAIKKAFSYAQQLLIVTK